ncbi:MAG TPA: thermonuclease family protein [Methylococcaceae bacterium]|jgi:micrococcal nuclease|nr:thermonuclease family protein [Methylococcaceae bacterium]
MTHNSKNLLSLLLCYLTLLTAAENGCASEVYRWRDDRGQSHFSDRPIVGADRIVVKAIPPSAAPATLARVAHVYDGDTIVLEGGEKIRLLGINTPEIGGGFKSEEAGGQEAKAWLAGKIAGRKVRLEQDATARDKYQRRLAHVFAEDGAHINLALVEQGLATTDIYPPNLKYVDALVAAERRAEMANRGLWALPEYRPKLVGSLDGQRPSGWQRLVGRPYAIAESRYHRRLLFSERFEVRIPRENLALFPSLESYLRGTVEARGWISRRGATYSILARHPSALFKR